MHLCSVFYCEKYFELYCVALDLQDEVVGEGGIEIRFVEMQVFWLLDLVR